MKVMLPILLLFLSYFTFAQKIEHFYDWQWKRVEANTARFYTLLEKKDTVWRRLDYFIHERKLQMEGYYKDTACKVAHGPFKYYHPNGSLEAAGMYVDGKKQGTWLRYYDNGIMEDSSFYDNGEVIGTSMGWHRNGYLSDSSVWNRDGSGVAVSWFDNGNPSSAGMYLAGKKLNGKWKFFHRNGMVSANEVYQDGALLAKQYFDESGKAIADTTSRDRVAAFPDGTKVWQKYLMKHLYFSSQWKLSNAEQAVVVVDWVIDEEGNVTDVAVSTPLHPDFDRIALEAIRRSPKWLPAISHNRTIKAYRRQPVTFVQQ